MHALLLTTLRNKLPMFGKESKKKQLINQLGTIYQQVSQEYGVPIGDFPPLATMQAGLGQRVSGLCAFLWFYRAEGVLGALPAASSV